ncbi:MAG: membrane protein insertion efficiency factor YidD [Bacilli bacterium]
MTLKIIIKLIRMYQKIPGSFHYNCKFIPTCSEYMIQSIEEYGLLKGLFNGTKRLLRCNPWTTCQIDNVIKKEKK